MQRAPVLRASTPSVRALRDGQALDLNRAQAGDLVLLPGVGPKLAQRIVEERVRRGGFRKPEELLEVKGIGPATFQRLQPFVQVTAAPTDRVAAKR